MLLAPSTAPVVANAQQDPHWDGGGCTGERVGGGLCAVATPGKRAGAFWTLSQAPASTPPLGRTHHPLVLDGRDGGAPRHAPPVQAGRQAAHVRVAVHEARDEVGGAAAAGGGASAGLCALRSTGSGRGAGPEQLVELVRRQICNWRVDAQLQAGG